MNSNLIGFTVEQRIAKIRFLPVFLISTICETVERVIEHFLIESVTMTRPGAYQALVLFCQIIIMLGDYALIYLFLWNESSSLQLKNIWELFAIGLLVFALFDNILSTVIYSAHALERIF